MEEKQMPTEELAYVKMNTAITRKQRLKWNSIRQEMWFLSDSLVDQTMSGSDCPTHKKASRLRKLIEQLPVFDADGKGLRQVGDAIEDF